MSTEEGRKSAEHMRARRAIRHDPITMDDRPSPSARTSLEPLLAARAVAQLLGVGVSTLYEWQRKGLIPYVRLPGQGIRFRASDLQAWIESRVISPKIPLAK